MSYNSAGIENAEQAHALVIAADTVVHIECLESDWLKVFKLIGESEHVSKFNAAPASITHVLARGERVDIRLIEVHLKSSAQLQLERAEEAKQLEELILQRIRDALKLLQNNEYSRLFVGPE